MARKVELVLDDATVAVVESLLAERNDRLGRRGLPRCSMASMCAELVSTGANRRIASKRWSRKHAARGKRPAAKAKPAGVKVRKPRPAPVGLLE